MKNTTGRATLTEIVAQEKADVDRQAVHVSALDVECPVDKKTAAKILGISTDTLDEWTVKYEIPHFKYDMDENKGNRGRVVYLASDILAFRERFRAEGRDIKAEVEEIMAEVGK